MINVSIDDLIILIGKQSIEIETLNNKIRTITDMYNVLKQKYEPSETKDNKKE